MAPWTARNAAVTGRFVLLGTGGAYNLWLGNHVETAGRDNDELEGEPLARLLADKAAIAGDEPDVFTVESEKRFARAAMRELREHPAATLGLAVAKAGRFWFDIYKPGNKWLGRFLVPLQAVLLVLALPGVWLAWRRRAPVWHVVVTVLYFNAIHAATVSTFRYSVPVMGYVLMFAAVTLARAPWAERLVGGAESEGNQWALRRA
jgi:hypothetical protein